MPVVGGVGIIFALCEVEGWGYRVYVDPPFADSVFIMASSTA